MSEVTGVFECFLQHGKVGEQGHMCACLDCFFSQRKVGKCGERCDYSEHFL